MNTNEQQAELTQPVRDVLAAHFIAWHDLDIGGPRGEWRCSCGLKFGFSTTAVAHVAEMIAKALADIEEAAVLAELRADAEARNLREITATLADHPVTEYGTTRCPNEGWIAAYIDTEDGTCSACGEVVALSAGSDR